MSKDAANLLGWFGKRKEGVVGDGLRAMTLSVLDCATELGLSLRAMGDGDVAAARKAVERLFKCEQTADHHEDELCNQISLGELNPQEREDLMHFIRKTDKIADWCKEAAIGVLLVVDVGIDVPKAVWEMLASAVADLESQVRSLMNGINGIGVEGSDVMQCVTSVREMERSLDQAYFDMMKAVYTSNLDAKSTALIIKIVDSIEMAADNCKGCSDTVVILHNAKRVRRRGCSPSAASEASPTGT